MTRQEFQQWVEDFTKRFPDVGNWLKSKPTTMAIWYEDCFSSMEFTDCRAVNIQLMSDGTMSESWNRDRIPAIFIKRCAEIKHARTKRIEEKQLADEVKRRKGVPYRPLESVGWNRSTFACVREIVKLPKPMRKAFIDQYFDSSAPVMTAEEFVSDQSILLTPVRHSLTGLLRDEAEDSKSLHSRRMAALNALGGV